MLGVSVQTFTQLSGCADSLCPFIWSRVCGLVRLCDGSDKGTESNFVHFSEKIRQRPWQWLDKRSVKKARTVQGEYKLTDIEKKREAREEKSREHAHNFSLISIGWGVSQVKGGCSQIIRPGGPKNQSRILLWRFTATAWKCAIISPRTLATEQPHVWPNSWRWDDFLKIRNQRLEENSECILNFRSRIPSTYLFGCSVSTQCLW
jgi:hypothetical protein